MEKHKIIDTAIGCFIYIAIIAALIKIGKWGWDFVVP